MVLKKVTWQDINKQLSTVNHALFQLIDTIAPAGKLNQFHLGRYRFGDTVDHCSGLAIILNKSCELFIENKTAIIPQDIIYQGTIFGINNLLAPDKNIKNDALMLTAGARTLFMLPNVTNTTGHNKLVNQFRAPERIPKSLFEQWHTLKAIAQSEQHDPWQCEILFFSEDWLEKLRNEKDIHWLSLKNFLLQTELEKTRHKCLLDNIYINGKLTQIIDDNKFNISHYGADTIKHLLLIGAGLIPGFKIATDENLAPITILQQAYLDVYKLRDYLPIVMEPCLWRGETRSNPIYYSLNAPTLIGGYTPNQATIRKTDLLYKMKTIIDALNGPTQQFNFRYIHHQSPAYDAIELANTVIASDNNLQSLKTHYPQRSIADTGPFMKGCIQLSERL